MTSTTLDPDDILTAFLSWDEIARKVHWGGASESVYRRALSHPEARVRREAFAHFRSDSDLMTTAAADPHNEVRQVAAESHSTPPMVLATFMNDRSRVVRELLVQNPSAPDFVREHLVHDPTHEVRVLVARQPLSTEAMTTLSRDSYRGVREQLARRRDLPPHVSITLAGDEHASVRVEVAAKPAPHVVYENLAHDPVPSVVREVAANRCTPPHVSMMLVSHPERAVRMAVARTTDQAEVLDLLADDPELAVRAAVSFNQALATETAARMLDTPSVVLRRTLLDRHHQYLPRHVVTKVLDQLLGHPRADVRKGVRRSYPTLIEPRQITTPPALSDRRGLFEVVDQRLPFELIAHAVTSPSLPPTVRAGLLLHPDTPRAVRTALRDHPNEHIRSAARTPRKNLEKGMPHP